MARSSYQLITLFITRQVCVRVQACISCYRLSHFFSYKPCRISWSAVIQRSMMTFGRHRAEAPGCSSHVHPLCIRFSGWGGINNGGGWAGPARRLRIVHVTQVIRRRPNGNVTRLEIISIPSLLQFGESKQTVTALCCIGFTSSRTSSRTDSSHEASQSLRE